MQEQLISFETAKLAKEKGFNEATLTGFHGKKIHDVLYSDVLERLTKYNKLSLTYEGVNKWTSAPTQSLLQKWLREVHNLSVEICSETFDEFLDNSTYWSVGVYSLILKLPVDDIPSDKLFDSYEEALEAGLYNALQLIK